MNIIIESHLNSPTGKMEARHFLESIEEAYYLVEVMLFVSFFPLRNDVINGGGDHREQFVTSLIVLRHH
jgi:hypothetical protein